MAAGEMIEEVMKGIQKMSTHKDPEQMNGEILGDGQNLPRVNVVAHHPGVGLVAGDELGDHTVSLPILQDPPLSPPTQVDRLTAVHHLSRHDLQTPDPDLEVFQNLLNDPCHKKHCLKMLIKKCWFLNQVKLLRVQ